MSLAIIIIVSVVVVFLLVWLFIHNSACDHCDICGIDMVGETEGDTICTLCNRYDKGEVV